MFLNKKNKSRLSSLYSGIVSSLISTLKTTVVFFYTALARLLLNNKENRVLEEHFPDAPQHWLNLIKRNHLNLNSFKKIAIKKRFKPGIEKAELKESSFPGFEKEEKKKIETSSSNDRFNQSSKAITRFSFKDKLLLKVPPSILPEMHKPADLHKTTAKMHFTSKVNKKKETVSETTVLKFTHIKPFMQQSKIKKVTAAADNIVNTNLIMAEQNKSAENMAGKYSEMVFDPHQPVSRMKKTNNNKHDAVFLSENSDPEPYMSTMNYKQQLKKTAEASNIFQQQTESVLEEKRDCVSPFQEQYLFHRENEISIDESDETYWQNLPDDVWNKLSLDKLYTFKKMPGRNNIRDILWNG